MSKLKLHPLLSKDKDGNLKNKHYDVGSKPAIKQLEEELTVCEMIGFAKGNKRKYQLREKGQNESDSAKIIAYDSYLTFLSTCQPLDRVMLVSGWMKENDIEFIYG